VGDGDYWLDELRWHWGDAYGINYLGYGRWIAQRRDDKTMLRANSPEELREAIVADYSARPVPRSC
jgi:hypothetical protein